MDRIFIANCNKFSNIARDFYFDIFLYSGFKIPSKIYFVLALLIISLAFIGMKKISISKNYLVIQNYYLPFRKTFRLRDIKEIFIERSKLKSPMNIKIITQDDKSNTFPVDNFYEKDWNILKDALEKRGLIVNQ